MSSFFKPLQAKILIYKEALDKNNVVFDKTNQMFLDLNLNILNFLATENAEKLDKCFDYNTSTMGDEFIGIIDACITSEKAQGTLLMFFLRLAKELEVKYEKIDNEYFQALHDIMTSKGYKYPDYISSQKYFALDRMVEIIKRREALK